MGSSSALAEELRGLEERLLDPEVRGSAERVDELLAEDFVEFGSSGLVYDKSAVIEALGRDPGFVGTRTLCDFSLRELSPTVVLVTYRIGETGTLRSSIWQGREGRWRMVFHQGTRRQPD